MDIHFHTTTEIIFVISKSENYGGYQNIAMHNQQIDNLLGENVTCFAMTTFPCQRKQVCALELSPYPEKRTFLTGKLYLSLASPLRQVK